MNVKQLKQRQQALDVTQMKLDRVIFALSSKIRAGILSGEDMSDSVLRLCDKIEESNTNREARTENLKNIRTLDTRAVAVLGLSTK